MRCETVRELFDELDGRQAGACLEAEIRDHLAACPACEAAHECHHQVATALRSMPAPALPVDLAGRIEDRLKAAGPPASREPRRRPRATAVALVSMAAASVVLAAGMSWALRASAPPQAALSFRPAWGGPDSNPDSLTAVLSSRSCLPDSSSMRVTQGREMDVTVSLNSPRAVEGARVHVVLPKGLAFSSKDHPSQNNRKVLTLKDDIPRGDKDFRFRVKGTRVGRWNVVALVEAGDSVVVSDATVEVSADDEERL